MRLGPYRLVRRIAVGGMAELFEARHHDSDQRIVVKVVLPQHAQDQSFVQMLADEAQLAMRLDHPNLVRMLDFGRDVEQCYLAMEYVDGPTLAGVLQTARQAASPAPPAVALAIVQQLLAALGYLHELADERGAPLEVVHRDVTPANVLVAEEGRLFKLGDFGIAQHRLRAARTRTGVIKGTVQYMAPEQITGSGIDARTDLYGVGLILFELLTLCPFISAEREVELLRLAENPPWRAPSSLRPELSHDLDHIVQRALRRFPEERFSSAKAFSEALGALRLPVGEPSRWIAQLPHEQSAPRPTDLAAPLLAAPRRITAPPRPQVRTPSARASSRWALRALLGGLALVGGGALGALLLAPPGHRPRREVEAAASSAGSRFTSDFTSDAVARASDHATSGDSPSAARSASPSAARSTSPSAARSTHDVSHPARPQRPMAMPRSTRPLTTTSQPFASLPATPRSTRPLAATSQPARAPASLRALSSGRLALPTSPDPIDPTSRSERFARLREARRALVGRGIFTDDLPAALRERLRTLEARLQDGGGGPAEGEVGALIRELAAVRVDRSLVEDKLKRVDHLVRQGRVPQTLRDRASLALQEFMDGRYGEANRQLNQILSNLGQGGP